MTHDATAGKAELGALVERTKDPHWCDACGHLRGEHAMDLVGNHFCEHPRCRCKDYIGVKRPTYAELITAIEEAALAAPPAPILTFEDVKLCPALTGLSRAQANAIVAQVNERLEHPPTKTMYPRPCGLCLGNIE